MMANNKFSGARTTRAGGSTGGRETPGRTGGGVAFVFVIYQLSFQTS